MPLPPNSTPLAPAKRHNYHATLIVVVALLMSTALGIYHRQSILDWWNLYNYTAPTAIAELADETAMNSYGRKVFYMNHPELVMKADFSSVCPVGGEQTIVLGCYHSKQDGIYLLDVNDPRLDGVEQVTAAHEMLHGAYDRLTSKERARVDRLLMNYYEDELKDERLRKIIDQYKVSEPDDVPNEMHSIFATEIRQLPTELEQYYKDYFSDRSKVVSLAERYQSEFTSRETAIEEYDEQIASRKQQIEATEADLVALQKAIGKEEVRLSQLKIRGDVEAYNAAVPGYNASINQYNQQVDQVKALIEQHNQLVTDRNNVALEADKLQDEINSKVQPIGN